MTAQIDTISVLAGGWSVKGLDLTRLPGMVIGVNDAGVRAPRVDAVVTMDRLWLEWRWPDLCRTQTPTWARPAALKHIHDRPPWLTVFECDWQSAEMSDEPGRLNGTNSGGCALNRAYQLRPRRVVLFGFDMGRSPQGESYWYPNYPWKPTGGAGSKYAQWSRQFEPAAKAFRAAGIEVLNASPVSRIPAFRKVAPGDVLEKVAA
jgi:hypothetical protein